jgi:hypothetical protein
MLLKTKDPIALGMHVKIAMKVVWNASNQPRFRNKSRMGPLRPTIRSIGILRSASYGTK